MTKCKFTTFFCFGQIFYDFSVVCFHEIRILSFQCHVAKMLSTMIFAAVPLPK